MTTIEEANIIDSNYRKPSQFIDMSKGIAWHNQTW